MSSKKSIKKRQLHSDCWDLDGSFICWLKERIPVYLKDAGKMVDLNYHKFNFEDRVWTQLELINELYEEVKYCYTHYNFDEDYETHRKRMCDIWGIIMPAMWW